MKHSTWRLVSLLLVTFIVFLALSTARELPNDIDQHPISDTQHNPESAPLQDISSKKVDSEHKSSEDAQNNDVKEATVILRKLKQPIASKWLSYTRKPRGFLGSTAYYAKEAFFLLFMNGPKQANLVSPSSQSKPKLAQPLSKAVKLLEKAATEESADALFLLAEMNFHGNFTHPVSYPQAFKYYQRLADLNGNSTAQYMLGFLYATGLSADHPTNQAKSMLYHQFAAEQGNTRSQMTLAYRHHAGIATPRSCDRAVEWYKDVADKAIQYYKSGPPGGHSLAQGAYRLADEEGGVYGEGASVSSSGPHAKQGGPTSDVYANVDDVLQYLHHQHTNGDIKATFSLARLHYEGGRGLKRDLKQAKRYFMDVAREYWSASGKVRSDVPPITERMASKAAGYLGRMFLRGEGIEQSFSKAKIWFTRGLQNGDALSQYSLGLMYMNGLGVEQDVNKAGDFFGAAADQDLAVAQTNLGTLFLDQGDVPTATKYFDLAARNSHIEAFYYLAELNNQGIGRERNCGMAAGYYKIVAEKAEAVWSSLGEANEAFEDGDAQKAIIGYMMAAEQGSEAAQANVAWLLDQSKPIWSPMSWFTSLLGNARAAVANANDAALALVYWTRSAKQQNVDSLVKMGDYYLSGMGSSLNPENAAQCYQAAAETLQSAQAMWNLGWMHENGIGLEQDFHLAKRLYDQALDTNPREAYLPVKLSLWKLRWRSWWNGVTGGSVHGIEDDTEPRKKRTFTEWLNDFLEADLAMQAAEQFEADDWDEHGHMPGGDEYYGDEYEIDDGILETLMIGGLIAVLAWLIYYRQQQHRAAEQRRRQGMDGEPAQDQPPQNPPAARPGQQADDGFFPQPGDPARNDWLAGGIGM